MQATHVVCSSLVACKPTSNVTNDENIVNVAGTGSFGNLQVLDSAQSSDGTQTAVPRFRYLLKYSKDYWSYRYQSITMYLDKMPYSIVVLLLCIN